MIIDYVGKASTILAASILTTGIAISIILLIVYACTGHQDKVEDSSVGFSIFAFAMAIILQIPFRYDPTLSSITANTFTFSIIIMSCLDKKRSNGGLIIGELPKTPGLKSGLKGLVIMTANAFIITPLSLAITIPIQTILLTEWPSPYRS